MPPVYLGATGVLDYETVVPEHLSDFALNVDDAPADTPVMKPDTGEGLVEDRPWDADTEHDITARSRRQLTTRVDAETEMERLQEKVSLLAMQKEYWQQRAAEQATELREAEAEVARLHEALTAAANRVLVAK